MGDAAAKTRSVLLSYSHDSAAHAARVLALANQLRGDGVDCDLDRYHQAPPEGWPKWCKDRIDSSDFVVMVCTETYGRRVAGQAPPGQGLGATWEGLLITQAVYDAGGRNTKFIPVYFVDPDAEH